jgi:ATP-dependent DNA ligase
VPSELVERGVLLTNDMGLVAVTAKKEGQSGLEKIGVLINRPLKMMLAQIGPGINETIKEMGLVAVEWKFDGARVQIHKDGNDIKNIRANLRTSLRRCRTWSTLSDQMFLQKASFLTVKP